MRRADWQDLLKIAPGAKKNAALVCAARFPVYNLMKSFESVINDLPLSCLSPPLSFIDDTKVQDICTSAKNIKTHLLNGMFNGQERHLNIKKQIAPLKR
jgi:hypothetical protein